MESDLRSELGKQVAALIVDQLGIEPDEVTPEADFINDLGADSLDTVELVMALEEAFDIEIPEEDVEKVRTVQDAVAYLKGRPEVNLFQVQRPLPMPTRRILGNELCERLRRLFTKRSEANKPSKGSHFCKKQWCYVFNGKRDR